MTGIVNHGYRTEPRKSLKKKSLEKKIDSPDSYWGKGQKYQKYIIILKPASPSLLTSDLSSATLPARPLIHCGYDSLIAA